MVNSLGALPLQSNKGTITWNVTRCIGTPSPLTIGIPLTVPFVEIEARGGAWRIITIAALWRRAGRVEIKTIHSLHGRLDGTPRRLEEDDDSVLPWRISPSWSFKAVAANAAGAHHSNNTMLARRNGLIHETVVWIMMMMMIRRAFLLFGYG